MHEDYAQQVLRRYEQLKSQRANFERQWSEIAKRVLPRADDFITKRHPGERREQYVFDSTAQLALPSFAAAMESMLTPRTQKWHSLAPVDDDLTEDDETRAYLERVRDLLFRMRYSASANFASQSFEVYLSLGAFGTGALFIEDGLSKGIVYQSIPLSEIFICENAQGMIDTVVRRYTYTVRQAYQRWGERLPEELKKHLSKHPDREFEFVHVVQPNEERQYGDKTYRGMPYKSCHVSVQGKTVLEEGGYRSMPYIVSRYVTSSREVYGRSPAWDAMADIMTLNEMEKTLLRHGQMSADPMWITADLDGLSPFAARPGAVNAGYMSDQGTPMARSLAPEGNPLFTLEMQRDKRQSVNRSFLVTLFQILVETPEMTATEALLRAQEKGALLAPVMGRQQSEFLGPLIARELDILNAAGALPPAPPALQERGGLVDIVYDSPLTRAQMAEEGVGILRTLEAITPIANVDPTVLKRINADRVLKRLAKVNGAPMDMLYTDDEMAAIQQQEIQAQQAQALLQAAPIAADTAKTLAETAKLEQGAEF